MTNRFAPRIVAAAAVLLVTGAFATSHATEPEKLSWRDEVSRSRALYDAGQFIEAEQSLTAFVKRIERIAPGDLELAEALTEAGSLYLGLGKFTEGTRHLERSLALWDRYPGVRHPGPLWAANSLVAVYSETGQLHRAQKLAEATIRTRQEIFNLYPLEQAHTLHDLASVYHARGKHREAESLLRKSISLLEQNGSGDDTQTMYVLVTMSQVLVRTGQSAEAHEHIQRAKRIGEKCIGPDSVFLARVFVAESSVYRSLLRPADALAAIERALAIVPASMDPLVQAALDEYARVLRQRGQKREAEAAQSRASEIRARLDSASRHTVDIRALARDANR